MIHNNTAAGLLLSGWLALTHAFAIAQEPAPAPSAAEAAAEATWEAARKAMQRGPVSVPLIDQANIALPEGYGFVPRAESVKVMEMMGNSTDDRFLGLIFPLQEDKNWFITVDYQSDGHINDEDAKDWDAKELLESLKEGTEEGNKFREQRGVGPIEVTGWIEPPRYEPGTHRLVWSVGIKPKGGAATDDNGVNYNTYLLGREGYISMDLVTSTKTVESEKPVAQQLLAAVSFNEGRRYADFQPSTDKVAAYGLAALVGGVAMKKLGLLAMAGVFFAKFAKLGIVAVGALLMGLRKFFKRGG